MRSLEEDGVEDDPLRTGWSPDGVVTAVMAAAGEFPEGEERRPKGWSLVGEVGEVWRECCCELRSPS